MSRRYVIAPSILSADFAKLGDEIESVEQSADWIHVDIMDGHFVPNLTIGPCVAKAIRKRFPNAFIDCHLMVAKPRDYLEPLTGIASQFTFHLEAEMNPADLCRKIRELGMQASISVKPNTSAELIEDLLNAKLLDNVLVMTVEPGFGGQKFMSGMMSKVKWIRDKCPELNIQVDGGVDAGTIAECARAGANVFVAGTAVFGKADRGAAIAALRSALE